MIPLKINNSNKAAIKTGKWKNPGADLYNKLLDAYDPKFGACKTVPSNKELNEMNIWEDFLKEAYLIAPVKDIKNSPYGKTPYSRSGCKYPHHVIRNGELVLSIPGVKAAYSRAKQQGVYKGELKNHLDEHMRELDLLVKDDVHYEEVIDNNFIDIESFLMEKTNIDLSDDINYLMEKSHGKLRYCYRIGFDVNTGKQVAIQFDLDPSKITGVGDMNNVQYALDKTNDNSDPSKIKEIGLDITKRNITSKGYIDFTTERLRVDRIFYRNGGAIQSVTIIPLFSKIVVEAMNSTARLLYQRDNKKITSRELFDTKEFQDNLVSRLKVHSDKFESYTTGEYSGDGKYKTTKLLWDRDMLLSYKYTPVLRGYTKRGREEDLVDVQNYIKNDLNNKFESTFNGDINIISSMLTKSAFHGESYDTISLPYATDIDAIMIDHDEDGYIECVIDNIIDGIYNIHGGLYNLSAIKKYQNINESYLHRSLNGKNVLGGENPNHKEALNFLYELKRITEYCIDNYTDDISYNHYLNKLKYINNDIALIEFGNYRAGMINKYMEANFFEQNTGKSENCKFHNPYMNFPLSNYSFDEIDTSSPRNLFKSIRNNIKYDNCNVSEWVLKSPSDTCKSGKGNCHDQSLLSMTLFRLMGYTSGQLFFIEYKDGSNIGGNTHTFTYFIEDGKYYWFETSWEDKAGIHGPYINIGDLKNDVQKEWEDDNINIRSHSGAIIWDGILFADKASYKIGMNLGEYVNSWTTIGNIRESLDWIDKFVHNEEFRENSYNTMINLNDPNALMVWMNGNIRYGWRAKGDGNKLRHDVDNEYFIKFYKNQSPTQTSDDRLGICWDQVELERRWFIKRGIEHSVYYIEIQNPKLLFVHVFLVYKLYNAYWWFEHSWMGNNGIHRYDDLRSLLLDVTIKHQGGNDDKTSPIYISNLIDPPGAGLTCEELIQYAHTQKQLNVNNLPIGFYEAGNQPATDISLYNYGSEFFMEEITVEDDSENTDGGPPPLPEEETSQEDETKSTNNEEDGPQELEDPESVDPAVEEKDTKEDEPSTPTEEGNETVDDSDTTDVKEEQQVVEEPKPKSLPKQTDKAESDKNGVRRKKLYIAFIEWCKEYNPKNSFGSIFDKDIFHVTYPFIPEECRYFYRLANPMLCVLAGDLTFFPVAELRKLNSKNSELDKMMIFAATPNDLRVFNISDKKVYRATEENGSVKLAEKLGESFDLYIQKMINKGDILNGPIEEYVDFSIFY